MTGCVSAGGVMLGMTGVLTAPGAVEEPALHSVLKANARAYKLRMRSQTADSEEFTYECSFTRKQSAAALTAAVRSAVGTDKIRSLANDVTPLDNVHDGMAYYLEDYLNLA